MDWSVGYSLDSSGDESVNLTPPPPEPSEEDEINVGKEDEDNGDDSIETRVNLVTEVEVDDEEFARVTGVEQVEERGSRDSESFDEEIEIDEACMQAELACAKGGGDRVLREERAWPTPGIVSPWKVHRIIYAKTRTFKILSTSGMMFFSIDGSLNRSLSHS